MLEKISKRVCYTIEKGDVPQGGKGLAHYLAKYVVSPPISLRRIIKYDGKKVRYLVSVQLSAGSYQF